MILKVASYPDGLEGRLWVWALASSTLCSAPFLVEGHGVSNSINLRLSFPIYNMKTIMAPRSRDYMKMN